MESVSIRNLTLKSQTFESSFHENHGTTDLRRLKEGNVLSHRDMHGGYIITKILNRGYMYLDDSVRDSMLNTSVIGLPDKIVSYWW